MDRTIETEVQNIPRNVNILRRCEIVPHHYLNSEVTGFKHFRSSVRLGLPGVSGADQTCHRMAVGHPNFISCE